MATCEGQNRQIVGGHLGPNPQQKCGTNKNRYFQNYPLREHQLRGSFAYTWAHDGEQRFGMLLSVRNLVPTSL